MISKITDQEIRERAVAYLSTHPNAVGMYGKSGMSAEDLRKAFDALPKHICDKYNALIDSILSTDGASEILSLLKTGIPVVEGAGDISTLAAFVTAVQSGVLSKYLVLDTETNKTLQEFAQEISALIKSLTSALGSRPEEYNKTDTVWDKIKSLDGTISQNSKTLSDLNSHVGTRPTGYTDTDTLWGVIGQRPNAFGRGTMWQAIHGIGDSYLAFADELTLLADSTNGKLADYGEEMVAFNRRLANLEAANKGFSYIEQVENIYAYRYTCPDGALPYPTLNMIGGVTQVSYNGGEKLSLGISNGLIDYSYDDESGIITLNSGDRNGATLHLVSDYTFTDGVEVPFSFKYEGGDAGTYQLAIMANVGEGYWPIDDPYSTSEGKLSISYEGPTTIDLWIPSGAYLKDYKFSFAFGSYSRHFTPVKPTAVSRLTNILPYSVLTLPSINYLGITYTVQDDGGIHMEGTVPSGKTSKFVLADDYILPAGTYVKTPNYANGSGFVVSYNSEDGPKYWQQGTFTLTEDTKVDIYLQNLADAGQVDSVVYPMIVKGTQIMEYEKPEKDTVFHIPAAVQALDGYGHGVDEKSINAIVFDTAEDGTTTKTYRRYTHLFDLTSNHWTASKNGYFTVALSGFWPSKGSRALSSKFKFAGTGDVESLKVGSFVLLNGDAVDNYTVSAEFLLDQTLYPDLDSWKNALKEWADAGDPLTMLVAFEEPVLTDVTDLFPGDNFLQISQVNTSTLTFENESNAPVAAQITFDITA